MRISRGGMDMVAVNHPALTDGACEAALPQTRLQKEGTRLTRPRHQRRS